MKKWKVLYPITAWTILSGAAFLLLLKYSDTEDLVYNTVQSSVTIGFLIATVTLVYVTLYHANISAKIIKEEKKRRKAEFGDKRISKSLLPLMSMITILEEYINRARSMDYISSSQKLKAMDNIFLEIKNHFKVTGYLNKHYLNDLIKNYIEEAERKLKSIRNIVKHKEMSRDEKDMTIKKWRSDFLEETNQIGHSVNDEARDIMIFIKKTYGYYTDEK